MLSRLLLRYMSVSASLILGGMFLGNKTFLASGLIVLVYLFLGIQVEQPAVVEVEVLHKGGDLMVDEVYEIKYRLCIKEGTGLVTLGIKVPDLFKVVEGSSFNVVWKGINPIDTTVSVKVRCEKRGEYRLEGLEWETRHPYMLKTPSIGKVEDNSILIVRPIHRNVRRVRDRRMFSRMPMPNEALILMGVPTTTFKEIREYRAGDSFKSINWKATARIIHSPGKPPMVNEYEREGRKSVWIFLNTASRMHTGTTVHNCFEYAVQSVLELIDYYINTDALVGLALYSDDVDARTTVLNQNRDFIEAIRRKSILTPDTGREQLNKVKELMLRVNQSSLNPGLATQVENIRPYSYGAKPLFILVTIVNEDKLGDMVEGITEMGKMTRRGRTTPPVLLIHISGYELVGVSRATARLRSLEDRATLNKLTGFADLVQWNPVLEGLNEAIIGQVRR